MKRSKQYYVRKTHRYMGIFIGIQFALWTLSGLYFTWTDLDEIHGDHLKKERPHISIAHDSLLSPQLIFDQLEEQGIKEIVSLSLVEILQKPIYKVIYIHQMEKMKHHMKTMVDARTGKIKPPITQEEAKKLAADYLLPEAPIQSIQYIEKKDIGGHHEYRSRKGNALPAWAITYENEGTPTIYVEALTGRTEVIRHTKWRIFDFLWMFHTMDYQERDDFNNTLIRAFSLLGIITISSGFLLFFMSSPTWRKWTKKRKS